MLCSGKMRELIILNNGALPGTGMSGGIRFLSELAKGFIKNGYEVHIVTSSIGEKMFLEQGLKVSFHTIQFSESDKINQGIELIIRMIKSLFCNISFHNGIIRSSDQIYDIIPATWLKLKYPTLKLMASVFHIIPHPSKRPGGFTLSNVMSYISQQVGLKLISKWADVINTENTFVKNNLCGDYGIPPERIIVVSGGINSKFINYVPWNGKKKYDSCFLSRIHTSKGVFDLINAWKYVRKCKENAKLAIAGGGAKIVMEKLKNEVQKLNLKSNVDILGSLTEEEKYGLLKSSKVFVLPSYEEGIPIVFWEAMYFGLPVITYYLPSYVDIKDYIVKVPLGNVRKLSEEIIRVLEDEDLARRLGDKGRSLAKEHTWDKVANYIISQIENLAYEGH